MCYQGEILGSGQEECLQAAGTGPPGSKLFGRLDKDGDGVITFEEFREALLLLPSIHAAALFDTCNCSTIDIGESIAIPPSNASYAGALFPDGFPFLFSFGVFHPNVVVIGVLPNSPISLFLNVHSAFIHVHRSFSLAASGCEPAGSLFWGQAHTFVMFGHMAPTLTSSLVPVFFGCFCLCPPDSPLFAGGAAAAAHRRGVGGGHVPHGDRPAGTAEGHDADLHHRAGQHAGHRAGHLSPSGEVPGSGDVNCTHTCDGDFSHFLPQTSATIHTAVVYVIKQRNHPLKGSFPAGCRRAASAASGGVTRRTS